MKYTIFRDLLNPRGTLCESDWDGFCAQMEAVKPYPTKKQQPSIKLGIYKNNSRASGCDLLSFEGVELDYDAGEISIEEISKRLNDLGITCLVYSTYTNQASHPKWRLLAPLSKSYDAKHRDAWVYAIDSVLGMIFASESYRKKQVFFFGRNPNSEYEAICHEGKPLDLIPELKDISNTYLTERQRIINTCSPRKPKQVLLPGQVDIIDSFNNSFDVGKLLEKSGYLYQEGRYISPFSSSGLAGVVVLQDDEGKDRVYSHHENDPLSNAKANDAFDAFRILEHEGDIKKAFRAASDLLFVEGDVTLESHNKEIEALHEAKQALKVIAPDNLKTVSQVAKALNSLKGGFDLWKVWSGEYFSDALWRHLLTHSPYKPSFLNHLKLRNN